MRDYYNAFMLGWEQGWNKVQLLQNPYRLSSELYLICEQGYLSGQDSKRHLETYGP